MSKRLFGVALLAALTALLCVGGPAWAVEEDEAPEHRELPDFSEIGTRSETAGEFYPEPYEAPSVFPKLAIPLLVAGGVIVAVTLLLYLLWQPRFAEERRSAKRR
jgi:hypothetical protein